jgi:hypothetical protein
MKKAITYIIYSLTFLLMFLPMGIVYYFFDKNPLLVGYSYWLGFPILFIIFSIILMAFAPDKKLPEKMRKLNAVYLPVIMVFFFITALVLNFNFHIHFSWKLLTEKTFLQIIMAPLSFMGFLTWLIIYLHRKMVAQFFIHYIFLYYFFSLLIIGCYIFSY